MSKPCVGSWVSVRNQNCCFHRQFYIVHCKILTNCKIVNWTVSWLVIMLVSQLNKKTHKIKFSQLIPHALHYLILIYFTDLSVTSRTSADPDFDVTTAPEFDLHTIFVLSLKSVLCSKKAETGMRLFADLAFQFFIDYCYWSIIITTLKQWSHNCLQLGIKHLFPVKNKYLGWCCPLCFCDFQSKHW